MSNLKPFDNSFTSSVSLLDNFQKQINQLFDNFGVNTLGGGVGPATGVGIKPGLGFGGFGSGIGIGNTDSTVSTTNWTPAFEIIDSGDQYVLKAELPGVDLKDVNITVDGDVLSVGGVKDTTDSGQGSVGNELSGYYYTERSYGKFLRQFNLPVNVDADKIVASSTLGILEIVVPKSSGVKTKKISIQSNG